MKPSAPLAPPKPAHLFAALSLVVALSGCSGLIGPDAPPPQIYLLAPAMPTPVGEPTISQQLTVALPQASPALGNARIALSHDETLDYYADAQWPDAAPQLLQDLLVRAFENAGAIGKVAADTAGVHSDYVLQSEIVAFAARYATMDAPPTVVVEVTLKLVRTRDGEMVAARAFHEEVPATANSIPAVVKAFDAAVSELLDSGVRWTLTQSAALPARS